MFHNIFFRFCPEMTMNLKWVINGDTAGMQVSDDRGATDSTEHLISRYLSDDGVPHTCYRDFLAGTQVGNDRSLSSLEIMSFHVVCVRGIFCFSMWVFSHITYPGNYRDILSHGRDYGNFAGFLVRNVVLPDNVLDLVVELMFSFWGKWWMSFAGIVVEHIVSFQTYIKWCFLNSCQEVTVNLTMAVNRRHFWKPGNMHCRHITDYPIFIHLGQGCLLLFFTMRFFR